VVALDPRTGEVLAMASHPSMDRTTSRAHLADEMEKSQRRPAKADAEPRDTGALAPGFCFKIVTATAMLEDKVPPENFTTFVRVTPLSTAAVQVYIYGKGSHGVAGLHKAILESCDNLLLQRGNASGH